MKPAQRQSPRTALRSVVLTVATALLPGSTVMAAEPAPGAASPQSQMQTPTQTQAPRRTTMLGSSEHQFYIAKITVSDLPRSFDFYTRVVGLRWATSPGMETPKAPAATDPEKDFVEIPLNVSGSLADPIFVLVKQRNSKPAAELTNMIWIGFKVPNAREAIARATAAGFPSTRGDPGPGPMTFGFVRDPDGYTIEFVQAPPFVAR